MTLYFKLYSETMHPCPVAERNSRILGGQQWDSGLLLPQGCDRIKEKIKVIIIIPLQRSLWGPIIKLQQCLIRVKGLK